MPAETGEQPSRKGSPATRLPHRSATAALAAEALGFESSFLVEHHFSGRGQVSAPLDLLAWVAARTTTLRLGTAVIVLPWHDPMLLAERAATLDLMSGGRLDVGVGKGYRHSEFAGFCIPFEEAQARFEEALHVIVTSWTSTVRFSHAGRFWQYEDVIVEPPATQEPHPPIWIAAGRPDAIRAVAARGCKLLLDQFASTEVVERVAVFRAEREARDRRFDPMDLAVARNLYVGRDAVDAQAALARLARLARSHAGMSLCRRIRAGSILAHHGLCRHTRRNRGKCALRHARLHRRGTRRLARRRRPAGPAPRRGVHQADHPAVLRGDHAGLRSPPRTISMTSDNARLLHPRRSSHLLHLIPAPRRPDRSNLEPTHVL